MASEGGLFFCRFPASQLPSSLGLIVSESIEWPEQVLDRDGTIVDFQDL